MHTARGSFTFFKQADRLVGVILGSNGRIKRFIIYDKALEKCYQFFLIFYIKISNFIELISS